MTDPVEAAAFSPDPVSRRLQADYIARDPNKLGEKDKLMASPRGDAYDKVPSSSMPASSSSGIRSGFTTSIS